MLVTIGDLAAITGGEYIDVFCYGCFAAVTHPVPCF